MPRTQSPNTDLQVFWQVDSVFQQTATPTEDVLPTWLSAVDTLKLTGEVVSSPSGLCQIDLNPINVFYLARTRLNK